MYGGDLGASGGGGGNWKAPDDPSLVVGGKDDVSKNSCYDVYDNDNKLSDASSKIAIKGYTYMYFLTRHCFGAVMERYVLNLYLHAIAYKL